MSSTSLTIEGGAVRSLSLIDNLGGLSFQQEKSNYLALSHFFIMNKIPIKNVEEELPKLTATFAFAHLLSSTEREAFL